MENTRHHQSHTDKLGTDNPLGYQLPPVEGLRLRINVSRVAAANRMSTFVRPSDLDAFINDFNAR